MTRIDKEAIKAKKEAARAIQYPRVAPAVEVKTEAVLDTVPKLTYREAQAMAKSLGLKSSGKLVDILARIEAA